MFLVMWVIGAVVASAGMSVYVEFGTVSSCEMALELIIIVIYLRAYQGMGEKKTTWSMYIENPNILLPAALPSSRV
jgi:hypothetical protein